MIQKRYLEPYITKDLHEKMVFVGGPRQVGKTTLSHSLGDSRYQKYQYLNWDHPSDRESIRQLTFNEKVQLVIFDEVHKYRPWKNHIKGLFDRQKFDKKEQQFDILVTGSARLDIYRRGGDSLMGRYHYYHLHPFSIAELLKNSIPKFTPFEEISFSSQTQSQKLLEKLLQFGGFPEPFLKENMSELRRWQNERVNRIIRDDIRDIELVRDLSGLEVLSSILPSKVGSLFSLNSIREDLEVAHETVALWTEIFERFYYHFRIRPFAKNVIKSLRREPKLYLWDWSQVKSSGAKFENFIASHLLKFVHFLHDTEGYQTQLFFLRDKAGREVDFLVGVENKPWFAVEVKESAKDISKHLDYFGERFKIPFLYQVVLEPGIYYRRKNIVVISAEYFLSGLV